MTKDELQEIISGCRAGNRLSQKALYRQFFRYGMSVCNRYTRSNDEAKEMLNDAFLRIFMKIDMYDPALSFPGWLHTIVVRSAINYLKKYENKPLTASIELAEHHTALNEDIIGKMSSDELIECVKHLPPSYRLAFNLAVVEGYSHVEIAKLLNISEGTSRTNLMAARRKLQIIIHNLNKN